MALHTAPTSDVPSVAVVHDAPPRSVPAIHESVRGLAVLDESHDEAADGGSTCQVSDLVVLEPMPPRLVRKVHVDPLRTRPHVGGEVHAGGPVRRNLLPDENARRQSGAVDPGGRHGLPDDWHGCLEGQVGSVNCPDEPRSGHWNLPPALGRPPNHGAVSDAHALRIGEGYSVLTGSANVNDA